MVFKKHERQYDLVVFGATGYTGQLTAEYIATNLPTDLKWAVAGRSESKLQGVVDECKKLNPDRLAPCIEIANLDDKELSSLAKKTFVLISTVGPYALYGEPAIKACAETGTHYLDVTGETIWVTHMIQKYEKAAKTNGAMLIPQIGLESAPADLSAWALARILREKLGVQVGEVTVSVGVEKARPSGGTLSSVINIFEHYTLKELAENIRPYVNSPVPHKEPARAHQSMIQKILGVHTVSNLGLLTTWVGGSVDVVEVERTWGLLSEIPSRKDEFYGPSFTFAEYSKARNWFQGVAVHLSLAIGALLLALMPPIRALAKKVVYQAGQGPSREDGRKESIEYRGLANPDTADPITKQAFSRAWYFGSMYSLTAVFLGSAAWTMLEDDLQLDGGIYTPACLGQTFIDRASDGGFKMEVKIIDK